MRFALVGTGFGQVHLQWLSECAGATVEVLCFQHDAERARRLAAEHGIAGVSSDPHQVLSGGGLDGAIVVSPPNTHGDLLSAALSAGLAVVTDKPLAADARTARALAARAGGARAAVTFQWRENPALRRLRDLVSQGDLGTVLRADLEFHHDFLAGPGTEWPWRHRRAEAGAGALGDQGVHLFDLLRWLVPGEWAVHAATSTIAFGERASAAGPISAETEDIAEVLLGEATTGCPARVLVSRVSAGLHAIRVLVQGERATAVVTASPDDGRATLTEYGSDAPRGTEFPAHPMNPYPRILDAWQTGVRSPEVATFGDGLAAQLLVERALAIAAPRTPKARVH
ncbi:oxidoreductase [Longimycelium tulufanense]|uniref:Oxidoreductase n=1 Tax=Longimycelium tulufanense TaxID=907463 RepID=A0A8J3CBC1_9PSEU|nr:oxidoreductase [Longimycelium tulufanense]